MTQMDSIEAEMYFPSKRDWWLSLCIWGGVVIAMTVAIVESLPPGKLVSGAFWIFVACCLSGFMLWILYGTGYLITGHVLLIRAGPFRTTVLLNAIRGVKPTRNPLGSPACSLDRLQIDYGKSRFGVMVSPADKEGFLRALEAKCPQVRLEGDRLSSAVGPG